jgi:hypothetical protein
MVVGGFGAGLSFPSIGAVTMGDVQERDAGGASGVLNTTFQLAAATGVAVLGAVFFGLLSGHADTSARATVPQIRAELRAANVSDVVATQAVDSFRDCFRKTMTAKDPTAVPNECRQEQTAGAGLDKAATAARRDNFAHAFKTTLAWMAGLFVLALVLSFAVPRPSSHGTTTRTLTSSTALGVLAKTFPS